MDKQEVEMDRAKLDASQSYWRGDEKATEKRNRRNDGAGGKDERQGCGE